ncbi:HpcH/HpaI aldolase/citrate lyase family protein [Paenibacillus nasutitermitis]|uniref:HpcH/HpaI aldolase/citrate lyase family protein n=1 Tax=Paenibacillus nasutitermitis TaxID=1652958 RepID=UPI00166A8AB4|nr:HpcH/HpaI aldolase/citrate lyase family protein [Paenibacillus nasutitermitis]
MSFSHSSDKELLAHAVGAALYMPATRPNIADDVISGKHEGLVSVVLDLEDAIGDQQVELAEESLMQQLFLIASYMKIGTLAESDVPLLFIRIRSAVQLKRLLVRMADTLPLITGFVLPKFTEENGEDYLQLIAAYNGNRASGTPVLYGLPILESASIIYRESRLDSLLAIKAILDHFHDYVLNVRIGSTDFSSLFGLRRSSDRTIYELAPIRDCIADIINLFGRVEAGYVISGSVWEYFPKKERTMKPQLRVAPVEESFGSPGLELMSRSGKDAMEGLIREVMMDKENGIIGKTIIHPAHIKPVQALYAVTHEEYADAASIIAHNDGHHGVLKSQYANKMNEMKPHQNWAKRILLRSQVYGVLHEQQHFITLLHRNERAYV